MLSSGALRHVLGRPLPRRSGLSSRPQGPVHSANSRSTSFLPRSGLKATRWYSTAQNSIEASTLSSFFATKAPIKCKIKVTMRLKPDTAPQAQFPGSPTYIALDSTSTSIPVMQRKPPATLKLFRAIAGLQKRMFLSHL